MIVSKKQIIHTVMSLIIAAVITGCGATASSYEPIVDGPKNPRYHNDLEACSSLAEQRSYTNDDVKSEALLGAGIGALFGALEDGGKGAVAGAVIGGATGGGSRAWDTRNEQKQIVIQCMRNRGHNVVG
ncbi:glycine zipper family protein [Oceanospirillum sediminis]|uniref:Glycine zipper family protein n=1 Tax=Oceanospirillum sediminis TaxID=2760088 RepID=A0A839IYX3_9GAMM|nr:glycine zipper family protein [Oceanospirillum sediminis]MBB1489639.1 glycine zipper family protein [Oceanospirillum sediminis]